MTAASPGGDPCKLCWTTWTGGCPINNCPREARQVSPPAAAGDVRLLPVARRWAKPDPPAAEPPTLGQVYGGATLEELLR